MPGISGLVKEKEKGTFIMLPVFKIYGSNTQASTEFTNIKALFLSVEHKKLSQNISKDKLLISIWDS